MVDDSRQSQSTTDNQATLICVNGCVIHCKEADALNTALAEVQFRKEALMLSHLGLGFMLVAYVYFAYLGKALAIPDIIWAVILGPYLGHSASQIFKLAKGEKK